ncbi:hypothetical protein QTQ03_04715 [Micromonospora sp. WMMA1363]|uniref:hypothetical protein n=1 Tax=Micromonospora sp. WMMA1363 TaxID=3053985 RepID=UPI00259CF8D9|nr:hypothetical protein [Micromonospora sp. WMMA1363]MDM4718934.1 hypothetical protein [Micromonospora sp. WMMA1363]
MVTWIVVALVLVPLGLLGLAGRAVLVRLPQLRRAAVALQRRAVEAEALQEAAETLQARVEALQRRLDATQRRLAVIKTKRGD